MIVKNSAAKDWLETLSDFNISLFNHPEWLNAVADLQHNPIYLDFIDAENIIAKSAGLVIKSGRLPGFQLYIYGGIAFKNGQESAYQLVLQALYDFAKNTKCRRVIIASYDHSGMPFPSNSHWYPNRRLEFLLELDKLHLRKPKKSFKTNLSKAKRLNPVFERYEGGTGSHLLQLLNQTKAYRLKQKRKKYDVTFMPFLSEAKLVNLKSSQFFHFYSLKVDNRIVALNLCLISEQKAVGLMIGLEPIAYKNGLSAFFFEALIQQFKSQNLTYYNLGGIPDGEDGFKLKAFKIGLGAHASMRYGATTNYITYPFRMVNPVLRVLRSLKKRMKPRH